MTWSLGAVIEWEPQYFDLAAKREVLALHQAVDADLVALSLDGRIEAFDELVRRYRNDVYGLAVHYVRDREDAWDLSQEVFVKAHRAMAQFRGDSSFKTWLLRITANHAKDFLKKRRLNTVALEDTKQGMEVPDQAHDPSRDLEMQELAAAIQEGIDALPHKQRTAFLLREFEGLSYAEMAEVMNCSMGTVMSRLHHARKKLQSRLNANGLLGGVAHEE